MITKPCPNCLKDFSSYPSQNKVYCSRACQKQAVRVTTNCPHCGKEFWYYKSWPRIYCSRQCSATNNAVSNFGKYAIGIGEIVVMCDNCGKEFEKRNDQVEKTSGNFCTQACFGQHVSKTRKGIPRPEVMGEKPHLQIRVDITCPICEKVFRVKKSSQKRRKFCSRECMAVWQKHAMSGENSPTWKGGFLPYYGPNWRRQRRQARKRDNYTCQRCNVTEGDYGRELDVHHKKPFREFGYIIGINDHYLFANQLDNLITLCAICHRAVEHYGETSILNLLFS